MCIGLDIKFDCKLKKTPKNQKSFVGHKTDFVLKYGNKNILT